MSYSIIPWFLQAIFKAFKLHTGKETPPTKIMISSKHSLSFQGISGSKGPQQLHVFLEVNFNHFYGRWEMENVCVCECVYVSPKEKSEKGMSIEVIFLTCLL